MKLVSKPWAIACIISCSCFACGNSDSGPAPGGAGGSVGGSGGSAGASGAAGVGGLGGVSGGAGATAEPMGPGSTHYLGGYKSYRQEATTGLDLDGRGGPTESSGHCRPSVLYDEGDLSDVGGIDNSFVRFYAGRFPWYFLSELWILDFAIPVLHISRVGGIPVAAGLMAADDSAIPGLQGKHDGTTPIDVLRDTVDGDPLKPLLRAREIEQVGNRLWIRFSEPLVISHRRKRTAQLTIHDPIIALPANADLDEFRSGFVLAGWLDPAEFKAESEEYLTQLEAGFCKLDTDPFAVADLEIGTNTGTCNAISFGVEILADKVVFGGLTDREPAGPQPTECVPLEE